jgi:hypothetical protein
MVEWLTYVDPKKKEVTITSFFFFIIFINMKVIITENRIYNIAKKELTKKFGDLILFKDEKFPNRVFYIDEQQKVYFDNNKIDDNVRINYHIFGPFLEDTFQFEYEQILQVTKEWLEEHYNLEINKLYAVNPITEIRWRNITNR